MRERRGLRTRERSEPELAEVIRLPVVRRVKVEKTTAGDQKPARVILLVPGLTWKRSRAQEIRDEVLWLFAQARHGST